MFVCLFFFVTGCPLHKVCHGWLSPCHLEQPMIQILHSVRVCCSLGYFSSFSRLFCSLLFPSKMFHFFCLVLSEILSAELWELHHKCLNNTGWPACIPFFQLHLLLCKQHSWGHLANRLCPLMLAESFLAYINFTWQPVKSLTKVKTMWQLLLLLYHLDLLSCHKRKNNLS